MKKSILLWTKTTYVATFILFLLCLTFSCQQQVEEGITEEEAKALVERDLEIYNEGNLALIDVTIDPGYVLHNCAFPEDIVGLDALKNMVKFYRTAYPDFHMVGDEMILKVDNIVFRWTMTGTNTGPRGDLLPTGKKMRISGVNIIRVVNGKSQEEWIYYNLLDSYQQLGYTITPPEEQSEQ